MTETEWSESDDPEALMSALRGRTSDRKLRLLGCAWVRRVWSALDDEKLRDAVEIAERYADCEESPSRLEEAKRMADALYVGSGDISADHGSMAVEAICGKAVHWFSASESALAVAADLGFDGAGDWGAVHREESQVQASAVRDVFQHPFQSIALAAASRTPTVISLARAAYDERQLPSGELDPIRLSILADALEETGAAGEIVSHLRTSGPHVRGCWAVDLCLGLV